MSETPLLTLATPIVTVSMSMAATSLLVVVEWSVSLVRASCKPMMEL